MPAVSSTFRSAKRPAETARSANATRRAALRGWGLSAQSRASAARNVFAVLDARALVAERQQASGLVLITDLVAIKVDASDLGRHHEQLGLPPHRSEEAAPRASLLDRAVHAWRCA